MCPRREAWGSDERRLTQSCTVTAMTRVSEARQRGKARQGDVVSCDVFKNALPCTKRESMVLQLAGVLC